MKRLAFGAIALGMLATPALAFDLLCPVPDIPATYADTPRGDQLTPFIQGRDCTPTEQHEFDTDAANTVLNHENSSRIDQNSSRIDENSQAIKDAISLSVAIPDSYLSPGKKFSLALGGGFTDGSEAFGGIGTIRIGKDLTAYAGGSTLIDGGTWAAKGGVRMEW